MKDTNNTFIDIVRNNRQLILEFIIKNCKNINIVNNKDNIEYNNMLELLNNEYKSLNEINLKIIGFDIQFDNDRPIDIYFSLMPIKEIKFNDILMEIEGNNIDDMDVIIDNDTIFGHIQ